MTFNDIIYKNFKTLIKKYIINFVCTSFSVTIFFIFCTINLNDNLISFLNKNDKSTQDILLAAWITIGIFSIVYVNYSFSQLMLSRKKQLGIFLLLGMSKRDIKKAIILENMITVIISLIIGLLLGTLGSSVFFKFLRSYVSNKNFGTIYNIESYLITSLLFFVIYMIAVLVSNRSINKLDIGELLNSERNIEVINSKRYYLGIIGIVIICMSLLMIRVINLGIVMLLSFILSIIGVFLIIYKFGDMFLLLFKKNNKIYYKNILSITSINSKFHINKKIISILTTLIIISVFLIGTVYGVFTETIYNAGVDKTQPYDLSILNNKIISKNDIYKIVKDENNNISEFKTIEVIPMDMNYGNDKCTLYTISQDNLNKFNNENFEIDDGQCILIDQRNFENSPEWTGREITLKNVNGELSRLSKIKEVQSIIVNKNDSNGHMIVVNDKQYEKFKKSIDENEILQYMVINLTNKQNVNMITDKIRGLSGNVTVDNKLEFFEGEKGTALVFLNVLTLAGGILLLAVISVLNIRILSETDNLKEKYKKLKLIGITFNEMKQAIKMELKVICFVPIILGSFIGYLFIYVNKNITYVEKFYALIVVMIIIVFQIINYLILKTNILRKIKNNSYQ